MSNLELLIAITLFTIQGATPFFLWFRKPFFTMKKISGSIGKSSAKKDVTRR
jgi:hypothetical protein